MRNFKSTLSFLILFTLVVSNPAFSDTLEQRLIKLEKGIKKIGVALFGSNKTKKKNVQPANDSDNIIARLDVIEERLALIEKLVPPSLESVIEGAWIGTRYRAVEYTGVVAKDSFTVSFDLNGTDIGTLESDVIFALHGPNITNNYWQQLATHYPGTIWNGHFQIFGNRIQTWYSTDPMETAPPFIPYQHDPHECDFKPCAYGPYESGTCNVDVSTDRLVLDCGLPGITLVLVRAPPSE